MGDKYENLSSAVKMLRDREGVQVLKVSCVYDTAPFGYLKQDNFLNICVAIKTSLEPYELLSLCNEIEEFQGRKRLIHWGPRVIDLDIILYEGYESKDEKLTIPHKMMWERAFVLIPLKEIGDYLNKFQRETLEESLRKIAKEDINSVRAMDMPDLN